VTERGNKRKQMAENGFVSVFFLKEQLYGTNIFFDVMDE
jgi:hypothetical protein